MNIPTPYLVFTGDATDTKQAKTAFGITEWRPELCIGQLSLFAAGEDPIDLCIPRMDMDTAIQAGAKTLLIGISPYTTEMPKSYRATIIRALESGLNVAAGLHSRMKDDLELSEIAAKYNVDLFDFRHRQQHLTKGTGIKRKGKRLLTVGTDCAIGKKFTALSISRDLTANGVKNTFRATGQTGYLISQSGAVMDTLPSSDFIVGVAENLSPENDFEYWDIIEGQGSLHHPSFCGGSMGLLIGSQPDVIVVCTEFNRPTMRGVTMAPPTLEEEINLNNLLVKRTNINGKVRAVSINTKGLSDGEYEATCIRLNEQLGLFVFDPKRPNSMYRDFLRELSEGYPHFSDANNN